MSALRAGGDVVIFAAGLGAWVATLTTAQTAPAIIWSSVGLVFGLSVAWVAWGIWCDELETDDPAAIENGSRRPPTSWTPEDARELSGRSNSFRPGGDAWQHDPDRTTRRETWEH